MFVCCECCVLSGRGLCDELITSPEESYRLCCVVVCDQETSRMRRPWPALGCSATGKKIYTKIEFNAYCTVPFQTLCMSLLNWSGFHLLMFHSSENIKIKLSYSGLITAFPSNQRISLVSSGKR